MKNIPPKILESHIAILGKTGSGKTTLAKLIVEYLLSKGQRVCIVDPVSAYWGLRSDATGKGPGFPVVIFGGSHGDVEIGGSHGAAIAEIVAGSKTPTVIDLKSLSVKDRTQFFTSFAVSIMQKNQGILHMIIDEAHLFAPKGRVNSNQAGEMLSETNNLITGGRGVGMRFILLTQRPAKLHNDCLASVETLIAMRLTLPADREAVEGWMKECASVAQGKEILSSLPRLATGEGWIWSPEADILERTKFPMIQTFDSSNPNNLSRTNVKLQSIDLHSIRLQLDKAATDQVNSDPVQLKRLLAKAQAELETERRAKAPQIKADPDVLKREFERGARSVKRELGGHVRNHNAASRKALEDSRASLYKVGNQLKEFGERLVGEYAQAGFFPDFPDLDAIVSETLDAAEKRVDPALSDMYTDKQDGPYPTAKRDEKVAMQSTAEGFTPVMQRIVDAIAELQSLNIQNPLRIQVAILCRYSNVASTGFIKAIGALRTAGMVDYPSSATITLTAAGSEKANSAGRPPTSAELQSRLMALLQPKAREVLRVLIARYPDPITREELSRKVGYTNVASTGFAKAVGRLRTMGLLDYPSSSDAVASASLFL